MPRRENGGAQQQLSLRSRTLSLACTTSLLTFLVATDTWAGGEVITPQESDGSVYWHTGAAVSGNGRYAVGQGSTSVGSYTRSYLYDFQTGRFYNLGTPALANPNVRAYDVSDDGVVVGSATVTASAVNAFRWTLDGGFEDLGSLAGFGTNVRSYAFGVSDDGTRVVGRSELDGAPHIHRGFVWVEGATTGVAENSQMYELPGFHTVDGRSEAMGISGDGRYAVGSSEVSLYSGFQAIRWDLEHIETTGTASYQALGTLGGSDSRAIAVNRDGRVVVGEAENIDGNSEAFRWEEGGTWGDASNPQMESLGTLGGNFSIARGVNADGNVVVGESSLADNSNAAFRWTRETGMESLSDWLRNSGVDTAWIFKAANGVSDDGLVITGVRADGMSDRAFIARVVEGGRSGVIDVEEYNGTIYGAAHANWARHNLSRFAFNGAHHRPLADFANTGGGICTWTAGDLARYSDDDGSSALVEAGLCGDLADDTVRLGLGVGIAHSNFGLANEGKSDFDGRYLIGEANWRPVGSPVLLSLTGLYGGGDLDIRRGYSNGGVTDYSQGETDMHTGAIRLRADWTDAFRMGETSFSPYASYTWNWSGIDGYTESGGAFPARFDAQSVHSAEVRVGVASYSQLTDKVGLRGTAELIYAGGDAAHASGRVIGLHGFSIGGGSYNEFWGRIGADLDVRLTDAALLSLSLHAATEGLDATISGAARLQMVF